MKIAVACDHGALALKEAVKAHLAARGDEAVDFGTNSLDSCDYPDYAGPAARAVADGTCDPLNIPGNTASVCSLPESCITMQLMTPEVRS